MTKRSAAREEFLASIVTTAVEGGTGYWAQVSEYKWDGLADRDVFAVLHEMVEDPGETPTLAGGDEWSGYYDAKGLRLDISSIASAISKICRGKVEVGEFGSRFNRPLGDYAVKTIAGASAANDGGDIDSDMADLIAQVALLGIVRYG